MSAPSNSNAAHDPFALGGVGGLMVVMGAIAIILALSLAVGPIGDHTLVVSVFVLGGCTALIVAQKTIKPKNLRKRYESGLPALVIVLDFFFTAEHQLGDFYGALVVMVAVGIAFIQIGYSMWPKNIS